MKEVGCCLILQAHDQTVYQDAMAGAWACYLKLSAADVI